jgi:hypothetical protein
LGQIDQGNESVDTFLLSDQVKLLLGLFHQTFVSTHLGGLHFLLISLHVRFQFFHLEAVDLGHETWIAEIRQNLQEEHSKKDTDSHNGERQTCTPVIGNGEK